MINIMILIFSFIGMGLIITSYLLDNKNKNDKINVLAKVGAYCLSTSAILTIILTVKIALVF